MSIQVTIQDYTDKSIVVRSVPTDALKGYAQQLKSLGGRYNPHLDYPSKGGESKEPGWIFPKTREGAVRQLVQQIESGQIPPSEPTYERKTMKVPLGGTSPVSPTFPMSQNEQQIVINVLKPEVGLTLYLEMGGQKFPMVVQSVETTGNIVTKAVVQLADGQQTAIELKLDLVNSRWEVSGYSEVHQILLN